jgi:hypothetical protein
MEELVRDHAHWADKRKYLKLKGAEEAGLCTRFGPENGYSKNCIDIAFDEFRECNVSPYEMINFEEIYNERLIDGEVCQHCQNVRKLKEERMYAGRRLGAVRSAITKMGRRIAEGGGK